MRRSIRARRESSVARLTGVDERAPDSWQINIAAVIRVMRARWAAEIVVTSGNRRCQLLWSFVSYVERSAVANSLSPRAFMSLPRTEPGGAPEPGPQSSFRRERLRFSEFSFTRSPSGHVSINVELEYEGQRWFGRSAGQSSPLGDLRMAAEAALRALEEFAEGSLSFELIGVKHIRAFDSNLVIVSIGVRDSAGTRLVGCYLADEDMPRGAALAVLNATNRLLGNYLATR